MKLKLQPNKQFVIKMIILAGVIALLVVRSERVLSGTGKLFTALTPLIAGAILAFILTMIVNILERILFPKTKHIFLKKARTPLALLLSIIIVLCVLALLLYLVVPQLIETVSLLVNQLPETYNTVVKFIEEKTEHLPWLRDLVKGASAKDSPTISKLIGLVSDFGSTLFTVTGSVLSALVTAVFSIIFAIYLVLNRRKLADQFNQLFSAFLSPVAKRRVYHVLHVARETFSGFFAGQLTEALILGSLVTIGMLIFGFPYAPMVGSAVGFCALFPIVGSYVGAAVGFIMIAPHSINQALLFILFLVILQQLEGNLIYPRVVGKSIGMPGMWVFASVVVGMGMAGISGVLFGVPLTATVYKLVREQVKKRNKLKNLPPSSEEIETDTESFIDEDVE